MRPLVDTSGRTPADNDPQRVVEFWRSAANNWFSKDPGFDGQFRDRFLALHQEIVAGQHEDWLSEPFAALALVILTDQFPRNAFRGTARMYATDALARRCARSILLSDYWDKISGELRPFICLPFAHSEDPADQLLSVALNTDLGEPWKSHAEGHRDIIRRFGRFPHRNVILGRPSTPDEDAYLATGGFQG